MGKQAADQRDAANMDDMLSIPDSAGCLQQQDDDCLEGEHFPDNENDENCPMDDLDAAAWDLETAKQQIASIKDLHQQVACLEEEHNAKEKEVFGLREQLKCLSQSSAK